MRVSEQERGIQCTATVRPGKGMERAGGLLYSQGGGRDGKPCVLVLECRVLKLSTRTCFFTEWILRKV